MKNLFKKILVACAIIAATSTTVGLTTSPNTSAACRNFLGMVSWECNTDFFKADGTPKKLSEDKIKTGIWVAVSNVVTDIIVLAAYLVVGFVIYGGYQYIFSSGDPGKVASGKKTLSRAFLGLGIVMGANIIMNAIRVALSANFAKDCVTAARSGCSTPDEMITSALGWVIGIAGVICVIFIVYGGIAYTTSAGDPGKLEKAKKTILYALIGLIIVGIAEIITAFVGNLFREAGADAYINETTIAKEIYENTA